MEASLVGYPALFTGYLAGEQLQRGYASADLFVFPSATDTFGNVVLEAQASGLPVIVSDEGGPQELMINGETGLVFRAGSTSDLATAIKLLASDTQRIALLGRNARHFTLDKAPDSKDTYNTILRLDTQSIEINEDMENSSCNSGQYNQQ
jgi:glycosyltransferase involved in cell wall biosynthesis